VTAETWIDRINEEGDEAQIPADTEPYLTQYVISELNQPLEDGRLLQDEEKGRGLLCSQNCDFITNEESPWASHLKIETPALPAVPGSLIFFSLPALL
jgi:hypothetical protein